MEKVLKLIFMWKTVDFYKFFEKKNWGWTLFHEKKKENRKKMKSVKI